MSERQEEYGLGEVLNQCLKSENQEETNVKRRDEILSDKNEQKVSANEE